MGAVYDMTNDFLVFKQFGAPSLQRSDRIQYCLVCSWNYNATGNKM